ncbi:methionine ABC transporter substrate-binding protein [Carnobacteriaceae bacterium zg-ZUI240]|nr:methionine ABC transporter substrate-binding protein [Carnobacteriaceae bacterium zg-ZUI240]
MKKLLTLVASIFALAACGQATTTQQTTTTKAPEVVKIGVTGSQMQSVWEYVAEKAKAENIDLQVVTFSDYVQPNTALAEGSLQMNAFQHRQYLAQWNKDHKTDIKEIGTTFIVPLYYFSTKYKSLSELPEGATILVPSEVAIQGRALVALQTAGVIKLKDGGSLKSNLQDVVENPKNIKLIEAESAQAPRLLQDVDAAAVNGSMAHDAGLKVTDHIFTDGDHLDTIPQDRYNIIAVNGKDVDNATYKKVVELFQSEDVIAKLNEVAPGQYYPVWKK